MLEMENDCLRHALNIDIISPFAGSLQLVNHSLFQRDTSPHDLRLDRFGILAS